jgi:hypothetical protein
MEAPTSPLFSEIYFQWLEHNQIHKILLEQHIIAYFRFVDDMLIIYCNEFAGFYFTMEVYYTENPIHKS